MNELFLSVFGVAALIAFVFYRLGYSQGHQSAHCRNAVRSMTELEKAVSNASQVLNSERKTIDFYSLRCKEFEELNDLFNANIGIIQNYMNELRGDIVEADTFNREMLDKMNAVQHFNKTMILMIGEQLEQSDFKLSSEEFNEKADKYMENDKKEVVDDVEHASRIASLKRKRFMESEDESE